MTKSSDLKTIGTVAVFTVLLLGLLGTGLRWVYNEAFGSNVAPFGYIDKTGAHVIDLRIRPLFPETIKGHFSEGLAVVPVASRASQMDTSLSYIDRSGRLITPTNQFINARAFSEGLAAVELDTERTWTFVDKTGKIAIKTKFANVQDFSEGLAGVQNRANQKWQFIDKEGNLAINQTFDAVAPFSQGRASVRVGEKWGLIDKAGRQILEPTYQNYIHAYHDCVAAVEVPDSGRVDYLNLDGKVKLSLQRTYETSAQKQGLGPDPANKKLVDIEVNHKDLSRGYPLPNVDASEGLVVFEANGKYGYKDLSGNTVVEPKYDYCWLFSEGRAIVLNSAVAHGLGYIDRQGQLVIPCCFSRAFPFSEGLAAVTFTQGGSSLYIDKTGKDVFNKRPFGGGLYGTPLADARSLREWYHSASIMSILKTKRIDAGHKEEAFIEAQSFHEGLARVGRHFIWM